MKNDKKQLLAHQVRELAHKYKVEILAHFYQRKEVKAIADFVGGSSQIFERARISQAKAILLCGVSFMAEAIAKTRPDLPLLVPRQDAGCPLAEAVSLNEVVQAKKEYPEALVVADVKTLSALKELADIEISPATAGDILPKIAGKQLIMLPGAYLADWLGLQQGQVVKKWPKAVCQVHELALAADLIAAKAEHPQALVAVNILGRAEVRALADHVGDAASIWRFCAENIGPEFIIVSETGLTESLIEAFPAKQFYETEAEIFCPNMKLTNLRSILATLEAFVATQSGSSS